MEDILRFIPKSGWYEEGVRAFTSEPDVLTLETGEYTHVNETTKEVTQTPYIRLRTNMVPGMDAPQCLQVMLPDRYSAAEYQKAADILMQPVNDIIGRLLHEIKKREGPPPEAVLFRHGYARAVPGLKLFKNLETEEELHIRDDVVHMSGMTFHIDIPIDLFLAVAKLIQRDE